MSERKTINCLSIPVYILYEYNRHSHQQMFGGVFSTYDSAKNFLKNYEEYHYKMWASQGRPFEKLLFAIEKGFIDQPGSFKNVDDATMSPNYYDDDY